MGGFECRSWIVCAKALIVIKDVVGYRSGRRRRRGGPSIFPNVGDKGSPGMVVGGGSGLMLSNLF